MNGGRLVARERAHAKINLGLRVLGRGEDGYHSLETLFLRLALADDVEVTLRARERTLECTSEGVDISGLGPVEGNLAFRAAALYARESGRPDAGFAIRIHKRIPLGGGLGGGSADAAAVLRALDSLSPSPLGRPALMNLALALGADVPFLASGERYALGWGRGERLLALPAPEPRRVELLLPPYGVSTAAAFGWLAAARGARHAEAGLLEAAGLDRWDRISELAANDLEAPVLQRHPDLAAGLDLLRSRGASVARMTGSGSTLFGVFADPEPDPDSWPLPTGWRRVTTVPG
jgi:4-diphosphocytidyl-2-C-methyl-D-erythritol kinase